jgi:MoaA/NifB/PqqE/SkfB family radical SAM enzyme
LNALRYAAFARRVLVRRGPPLHLTLFVTGRCNLRCRHCFHWREVAAGTAGPSLEQLERLAESAARLGPLLWVSFGGGEPFLRDDLAEAAGLFGRRGLRHLAIPTNGLLPERALAFAERVLEENPELFLSLAVSFDGPPEVHDRIRAVEGGHARAAECARALLGLAERRERLGVGLALCVTRSNQEVLAAELERLVRELRPHNVTVNLARQDALDRAELAVDPARYEEVVATKLRLRAQGVLPYFRFPLGGIAAARDELMHERVAALAKGELEPHLPCTAGTLSAVVFEDGSLHPCEVLGRPLGNLNDVGWDLGRLWGSEEAERLRDEIRRTRCACTWECAQGDNVLFRARSWPRLVARTLGR